jgi:zinc D-Ala-D-Ala carboxypeptidase
MIQVMSFAPHFSLAELTFSDFAIRHGIDNTPPPDIAANLSRLSWWLEEFRQLLNKPIIVSSGFRCQAVNDGIHGSQTSAHMRGLAADIVVPGMLPLDVAKLAAQVMHGTGYDQIIHEFGRWTHVGLSSTAPRFELFTAKLVKGKTAYSHGLKPI